MYEKLKKVSLRGLRLLQVLLILIPLVTLFSWLCPENGFSQGVIGGFLGVNPVLQLLWNNKLLGLIGSAISLLPLMLALIWLAKLFRNYANGNIFISANSKIYSRLGYLCIISALILQPISEMIYALAISINYPVGQRFITFGFHTTSLTGIVCGVCLIAIAYVMQIGHAINEEQNLTI